MSRASGVIGLTMVHNGVGSYERLIEQNFNGVFRTVPGQDWKKAKSWKLIEENVWGDVTLQIWEKRWGDKKLWRLDLEVTRKAWSTWTYKTERGVDVAWACATAHIMAMLLDGSVDPRKVSTRKI